MYRTCSWTWIKLNIIILLVLFPVNLYGNTFNSLPIDKYSEKYDIYFRKGTKKYFGVGFDYR
jgi:hypothetical protein